MTYLREEVLAEDLSQEVINLINSHAKGYFYSEDDDLSSTSSTEFYSKVALTAENLSGDYRLGWHFNWNHDSTSSDFHAVIYHVEGMDFVGELLQEPKDSSGSWGQTGTDQMHSSSGFKKLSLTGDNTFIIYWRSTKKNKSASIWNARLELQEI